MALLFGVSDDLLSLRGLFQIIYTLGRVSSSPQGPALDGEPIMGPHPIRPWAHGNKDPRALLDLWCFFVNPRLFRVS